MASKKHLKKENKMLKERITLNHKILVSELANEKRQTANWRNKYFDLLDVVEENNGKE